MPWSTTEANNGTLLRSVLSKTALTSVSPVADNYIVTAETKGLKDFKDYRKRASSILLHRRSNSVQTSAIGASVVEQEPNKSRRQRSLSHLERLRPLKTSRSQTNIAHEFTVSLTSTLSPVVQRETFYGTVLHHGTVQYDNNALRKKSAYLVLTEHYLLLFKDCKRAGEYLPRLAQTSKSDTTSPPSPRRANHGHASGSASSPIAPSGPKLTISIGQIVAIRQVKTSKTRYAFDLYWTVIDSANAECLSIYVDVTSELSAALNAITGIARGYRIKHNIWTSAEHWRLIRERIGPDYQWEIDGSSIACPVMFESMRSGNSSPVSATSSTTDNDLLPSFYIIVGRSKIFILSLDTITKPIPGSLQSNIGAFGLVSLHQMNLSHHNHGFTLAFRYPQESQRKLQFNSVNSLDIITAINVRLEVLRPHWPLLPCGGYEPLETANDVAVFHGSPRDIFHHVLQAYCAAWGICISSIEYAMVDDTSEDSPRLRLVPRSTDQPAYTVLELLAVLRALRYNDYFVTICFAGVSMDELSCAYDRLEDQNLYPPPSIGSRSRMDIAELPSRSLLFQELCAISMTTQKLRRMDLDSCLSAHLSSQAKSEAGQSARELVEPFYSLCSQQLTNIDWLVFNNIQLSSTDVDYVMAILSNKACHIRCVELSGCKLDMWSIKLLLNAMPIQCNTLEVIDISNNPGRLSPELCIVDQLSNCRSLRRLNLSRLSVTHGTTSLLPIGILASWRLEELRLSQTSLNAATVHDLVSFLRLPNSIPLQGLYLDGCGLDAEQISQVLQALSSGSTPTHEDNPLHLDISNNPVSTFEEICQVLSYASRPSRLTWRLLELQAPVDFVLIIKALTSNTAIKHLDLSQLYLDFSLSDSDGTSAALSSLLAKNQTLEWLDLSANNSRLDDSQFGASVHKALSGLAHNVTLHTLRIEDQAIGSDGARALAHVLRNNSTLRQLHCDGNNINLASLTLLVDALQHNRTLTCLSNMNNDKVKHIHAIEASIIKASRPRELQGCLDINAEERHSLPEHVAAAIQEVVSVIDQCWTRQQNRLENYLRRNRLLASGQYDVDRPHDDENQINGAKTKGIDGFEGVDDSGTRAIERAIQKLGITT